MPGDPARDETADIKWWESLSESAQAYWLQIAKSCMPNPVVADAWAVSKRVAARAAYMPQ